MEKDKFLDRLGKTAVFLIIYTLLVIVWGAWVRISHSGNGCGDTWPLCQGVLIPEAAQKKTWIEYAHRLMSGIYGLVVLGIFLVARKRQNFYPQIGKPALYTFIFMVTEALLGAKLVLFGLVGSNSSLYRAFVMSLHQINSLLLVGSTVWLAWSCYRPQLRFSDFKNIKWPLILIVVIASSGAWAALASTLFPAENLQHGLLQDLSGDSPTLLKLRILHPLIALLTGTILAIYFWKKENKQALQISLIFVIAMIFGMLTLLLLSPVWMKLTHLLIAQAVWISVISYGVISLDSTKR